jgi:hypothetical protein
MKNSSKKPVTNVFKIIQQKALDFSFLSEKDMLKFPIHKQFIREQQKIFVTHQYTSESKFNHEGYKDLIIKKLKKAYNASSVVYVGEPINETILK